MLYFKGLFTHLYFRLNDSPGIARTHLVFGRDVDLLERIYSTVLPTGSFRAGVGREGGEVKVMG